MRRSLGGFKSCFPEYQLVKDTSNKFNWYIWCWYWLLCIRFLVIFASQSIMFRGKGQHFFDVPNANLQTPLVSWLWYLVWSRKTDFVFSTAGPQIIFDGWILHNSFLTLYGGFASDLVCFSYWSYEYIPIHFDAIIDASVSYCTIFINFLIVLVLNIVNLCLEQT